MFREVAKRFTGEAEEGEREKGEEEEDEEDTNPNLRIARPLVTNW